MFLRSTAGLILLIACHFTNLHAQGISSGPSSNSASGIQAGNTPVTPYTGAANISIPLHQIDAWDIQVPIQLRYHASGIKVSQQASQVGLGWSLEAGGVITREVRGYPDEMVADPAHTNSYKPIGYLHHGSYTDNLWDNPINGANAVTAHYNWNWTTWLDGYTSTLPVHDFDLSGSLGTLKKDTEADIYHFQFGKYSGKFTFDASGNPKLLNDNQDLKLEYKLGTGYAAPAKPAAMSHISSGNLGLIEWFKITTPDGTEYTFAEHEVQMVFNPHGNNLNEDPRETCLGQYAYQEQNLTSHHVSAWYVSSIKRGIGEIQFTYDRQMETNYTRSQQLFSNKSQLTHTYTVTEVPTPYRINWAGGAVEFEREQSPRQDLYFPTQSLMQSGASALKRMVVYGLDGNSPIDRSIEFNTDYFPAQAVNMSNPCPHTQGMLTANTKRLRLLSIQVTESQGNEAAKTMPPTRFEYDNRILPNRYSNEIDLWGYYNGNQPGGPDLSPTLYYYPNDATNQQIYLGKYSPIKYDNFTGPQYSTSGIYRHSEANAMQAAILKKITYPTGGYTKYTYEPHRFASPAHNQPLIGGGLRIKSILRSTGISENARNAEITTIEYKDENGVEVPGKLQAWPSFAYNDPYQATTQLSGIYNLNGPGLFVSSNNLGIAVSTAPSVLYPEVRIAEGRDRGWTQYKYDIPIDFTTQTADPSPSGNIYQRSVSSLYSNHGQVSNSPFAPNPNYQWRVALKEKRTYQDGGKLLQRTVNEYEIAKAEKLKRIRWRFFNRGNRAGISPPQPLTNHEYVKYYDIHGWYRLVRSTTYTYDETNAALAIAREESYRYSPNHKHFSEVKVINSDGTKIITRSKYPSDYTNIPSGILTDETALALRTMQERFILSSPVEVVQFAQKPGKPEVVTGASIWKYGLNPATQSVMVREILKTRWATPIPTSGSVGFQFSKVYSGAFTHHNAYQTHLRADAWNDKDRPTQLTRPYHQPRSFIWGKSYPYNLIAEAANAPRSDIGFCNFETSMFHSNWNFSTWSGNGIRSGGHTGKRHYQLKTNFGATGVFDISDQRGKYTCSAWVKSTHGVNLVLTTRKKGIPGIYPAPSSHPSYKQTSSGNTQSKWKLVEVEIDLDAIRASAGSTQLVDMDVMFYFWNPAGQPVMVDDIRFGPSSSEMETSQYHAKGQLQTRADLNHRQVYFDYGAEGRHRNTYDDEGIIFANEYKIDPSASGYAGYHRQVDVRSQYIRYLDDLGRSQLHEWSDKITYFDGMMRPIQIVNVDDAPDKSDLIQIIDHNNYGLRHNDYLPYTDNSGTPGRFRSNALTAQSQFCTTHFNDANGHVKKDFDRSPLNRVMRYRPMGNLYANPSAQIWSNSVARVNSANEVRKLDGVNSTGYYPAATLLKMELTDLRGNKSWDFFDLMDRKVLTMQEVGGGVIAKTYYSYNEKGQLVAVIPPEQTKQLEAANWSGQAVAQVTGANNQVFQNSYDGHGRLVEKWTPKGHEKFLYDLRGRLSMSTNAELLSSGKWQFVKYDAANRPVMTGIYQHPNSQTPLRPMTAPQFETRKSGTPHGYSNVSFPTSNLTIQNVLYYDGYDLNGDGSDDQSFTTNNQGNFVQGWPELIDDRLPVMDHLKGTLTAKKTNLTGQPNTYLKTVFFFNRYGYPIQLQKENHLGGSERIDFIVDFAGKVREKWHAHQSHPQGSQAVNHTLHETFAYDHQGRLLSKTHKVDQRPAVTLEKLDYNPLGDVSNVFYQVQGSGNHLNQIHYDYNLLGQVTQLTNAFFSEKTSYDPHGNVSGVEVDLPVTNPTQQVDMCSACGPVTDYGYTYSYTYDKLNRLTRADHNAKVRFFGQIPVTNYPDRYSVNNISYNLNGDLLTLNRNGFQGRVMTIGPGGGKFGSKKGGNVKEEFGLIDQLTYTYHKGDLVGIDEASANLEGFRQAYNAYQSAIPGNPATYEYSYNANGYLTKDKNKEILQITYNELDLPINLVMENGTDRMDWVYDGEGRKLRQVTTSASGNIQKDYCGVFEYIDGALKTIRTSAGRVVVDGASMKYEYEIRDQNGNVRLTLSDLNGDGTLQAGEVLQQHHYYPFGMTMKAVDDRVVGSGSDYQFGGKESLTAFDLNTLDFGPRHLDPAQGRWTGPDLLASAYPGQSPFAYVENNPATLTDLTGMSPDGKDDRYEPREERPDREDDRYDDRYGDRWDEADRWEDMESAFYDDEWRDEVDFMEDRERNQEQDQVNGDPPGWGTYIYETIRDGLSLSKPIKPFFVVNGFAKPLLSTLPAGLSALNTWRMYHYRYGRSSYFRSRVFNTLSRYHTNASRVVTVSKWIGNTGKMLGGLGLLSTGYEVYLGTKSVEEGASDMMMIYIGMTGPLGGVASLGYFFLFKPWVQDEEAVNEWARGMRQRETRNESSRNRTGRGYGGLRR